MASRRRQAETRITLGTRVDFPPGTRRTITVGRRTIALFNVEGTYRALRDRCPHRGAQLSEGAVGGTMLPSPPGTYTYGLDGFILTCPWHRWAFDMRTGPATHNDSARLKIYRVEVEDGDVVLYV